MAKRTAVRHLKAATSKKKTSPARKATATVARKVAPSKKKKTARRKAGPAQKTSTAKKTALKKPLKASARKKAPATKATPTKAAAKKVAPKKAAAKKAALKKVVRASKPPAKTTTRRAPARANSLDSRRRELEDMVPSPPSSLNMNRRGSAVRTGREEMAEHRADHATLTPSITGGDVDANVEDAYFTGDEAPGGDNSTPDQDIVDDIGKALGVQYQDNEELRGSDKVADRDKHRWELDPASAEDYRDRDRK